MTGINDFISHFKNGYRPNRFKVEIDGISSKLEFLCRSATIPASEIGVVDVTFQGLSIPVPGDRPGGKTWDIEVFLDVDMAVRKEFELWHELIRPQEVMGGVDVVGAMRTGTVDLLDTNGNTIQSYRIIRCWPMMLGEIALDQESTDTIAQYPITLTYTAWSTII